MGRRAGNPAIYDYGRMRETWLVHLCTDWMGDDAWLANLDVEFRKFNYVGDTHWMGGRITRKYLADGDRPPSISTSGVRTSAARSPAPGTPRSCCRAGSTGRSGCPNPPGGATTCQAALDALVERFARMEQEAPDDR